MKFIRELRMGVTKTFKTGATAGTYPKPLVYLGFDQGGLDIIPSKNVPVAPGDVAMNVTAEEIVSVKPGTLDQWVLKPESEQPKILYVNYFANRKNPLEQDLRLGVPDEQPFIDFVKDTGTLYSNREKLPWKTVELDSVTGQMDVIISFIASKNSTMLTDARQWASQVGMKVKNTCASLSCLNAHIIVLMHTEYEKNDLTGMVTELPAVYSGLRNDIGCYFSQFFYATNQAGKPVVSTKDYQFVRGLGMRWPTGLPAISQPDFKSLYGKEFGL